MFPIKSMFFTSLAILTSCGSMKTVNSSTVDQKNIYESYSVSFDKTSRRLSSIAQFRSGSMFGDTLLLDSGSTIKYQGNDMRSTKLSDGEKLASALIPVPFGLLMSLAGGNWYVAQEEQVDRQGGESAQFVYSRNDGVVSTYSPVLPKPVTAKNVGQVSKSSNFVIELSRSIDANEKVECYLRSKGSTQDAKDPNQTDSSALAFADKSSCAFSADKLKKMLKGPAEVFVSVRNSTLSSDEKLWISSEMVSEGFSTTVGD